MDSSFLLSDEYFEYLESLPCDDREQVLEIHAKHFGLELSAVELFAVISNKDLARLKGKKD